MVLAIFTMQPLYSLCFLISSNFSLSICFLHSCVLFFFFSFLYNDFVVSVVMPGAVTSEEIPFSSVDIGNRNQSNDIYIVRFIQHETVQQRNTASLEMMGADPLKDVPIARD